MTSPDTDVRVVTLGTAGGPRCWPSSPTGHRAGISTAVLVGGRAYLVDAGLGTTRQLERAGIPLGSLRAVFLTHMHSDHVVEIPALLLYGLIGISDTTRDPIRLIGPGDRGALPPVSQYADGTPTPEFADTPTSGTVAMVEHLRRAFSADITDRVLDGLRLPPSHFFVAEDIDVPAESGYHPNDAPTPPMEPFEVYRDDLVTVTAILVQHPPVAPAFAFRFQVGDRSVTISGDTAPCANMVTLARGTDLLLHEAIDFDWVAAGTTYAKDRPETAEAMVEHHRKSHTSPAQAAELAERAGARVLGLHHLVPGHGDFTDQIRGTAFSGPVVIPDDLAVFDLTDPSRPVNADRNLTP